MKLIRGFCLVSLFAVCAAMVAAQSAASSPADDRATTKAKFELGIEMFRGYRGDLQDRLEKSVGLLIIVVGWLITSETARKSLSSNSFLWCGSIAVLTALMIMYCLTISNFVTHCKDIQKSIDDLHFMESWYLTRYRMPDRIFGLPVELSYIAPVASIYVVIVLILIQIRYRPAKGAI
jgi:hypothetical protein